MATQLEDEVQRILSEEAGRGSRVLAMVDRPRQPIQFPGVEKELWMRTDVSGRLRNGDEFFIELDATTDPARSLVKYWPYLESLRESEGRKRVHLVVFWSRTDTIGQGVAELADFIGRRFLELYPSIATYVRKEVRSNGDLRGASGIAEDALDWLSGAVEVEP